MRAILRPGLRHRQRMHVDDLLTAPDTSSDNLATPGPGFGAAFMVALIDSACLVASRPFLRSNERTVGTHIDVSHKAAAPAGSIVTVDVELVAVEALRLQFAVLCRDTLDVIAT